MKNINILNNLNSGKTSSYFTTNGTKEFTCNNAGYVDNVAIEGKTLVNLASCDMGIRSLTESSGNIWTTSPQYGTFTNSNGLITFTTANESWIDFGSIIPVTEGTSIRFIVNIIENGGTKTNCIAMFFNDVPVINSAGANVNKIISLNKVGTTTSLGLQDNQFKVPTGAKYALFIVSCSEPNTTYKFDNFMLLENNEDDFISYFEGLKSVGQGDNIEVLSYKRGSENLASNLTFTEGKYVVSIDGGIGSNVEFKHSNEYIEIEGGCEYLFDNINGQFAIYDSSKNVIPTSWVEIQDSWFKGDNYQSSFIYAMPKNAKYVRINLPISNLKPYSLIKTESDIKQIPVTLRSLPNGVKDTIEKRGNKYVKVQRCGETVIGNNLEATGTGVVNQTLTRGQNYKLPTLKKDLNSPIYCSHLKSEHRDNEILDEEHIINLGDGRIRVRVLKSKLSTDSLEGSSAYWDSVKPTIVYELETPIITELPNFNPQTYKGENTLIINSGVIQCDASFDVCEGIRSELDLIKDKVSNLDVYINPNKIDFTSQCSLLNGWKVWGKNEYFNAFVVDNCVKVTCLIYQGTTDAYTGILKIPKMYAPTSSEFIPMVSDSGSCFTACLDPGGYLTNESKISNFNWISFNFTYPLSK